MNTFGRHHQGATVAIAMRGILRFEDGDDRATIFFVQVGEKYFPVRLATPQDGAHNDRNQGGHAHQKNHLLLFTQPVKRLAQTFHRIRIRSRACHRFSGCCH